jgi:hypothetical protein
MFVFLTNTLLRQKEEKGGRERTYVALLYSSGLEKETALDVATHKGEFIPRLEHVVAIFGLVVVIQGCAVEPRREDPSATTKRRKKGTEHSTGCER